ncbi:Rab-like protein 6 [Entomortierella beljakovae]|nr:Rab-like protein 6 [Entomortierella beljakovae]
MFQKLWPFANNSQPNGSVQAHEQSDHGISTKVRPIHASFNKGIPLNMKIVIRGDIRTGKTSLFERLQGLPFRNELSYRTTDQIQVANVPWQYPHTKDIIKVEIWDVVDQGVQTGELKSSHANANPALKIDNNAPTSPIKTKTRIPESNPAPHAAFSLDASTIDVYRNTEGVILLYDLSKPWTIDYASKTLTEIPANVPVLLLSNFSDDSRPKLVMENERVEALIQENNEERRKHPCAPANLVRHLDTNMKTGLGLQEIHQSFGIPFLNVLRETHRKQFELKTQEINELLHALGSQGHNQSKRQIRQSQLQLHISTSQTQNKALNKSTGSTIKLPVPQTSLPTSPARKTRNDHTNVDILSPTPVSAQPPAVLLDFNAGKLEEDFFQNAGANSTTNTIGYGQGVQMEPETNGNPMVAGDEDIEDEDIKDDKITEESSGALFPTQATVWSTNKVEKRRSSHQMTEGFIENNQDKIQDDNMFNEEKNDDGLDSVGDSTYQTQGIDTKFSHLSHPKSELDSIDDTSSIRRTYYHHEPPTFVQDDQQLANTMSRPILSHYGEIAGVQSENPWTSAGDSLDNSIVDSVDIYQPYKSQETQFNETGNVESTALSETHDNDGENLVSSTHHSLATGFDETSSTPTMSTDLAGESIISPASENLEVNSEKEKKTKKSKKKNKKNR